MINFSRLLLAIEQEGAKVYWHMDPAASSTARDVAYPEQVCMIASGRRNEVDSKS